MKQYTKYKHSGVQWLGNIPEHWEVRKIKYSGQFAKGKLPNKTNEEKLGLPVIGASEMLGKDIRTFTEDFSVPQCTENDILILWDGANAGITASGLSGVVSSTAMKYTITDDKYLPDFVKYFFKALEKHFKSKVGGTTIPHMNMAFINEVPFLCPSKSEQRSIASYLDEQVSRIDRAIAQQQQMIALLGERKQIVINHAVTRGLNENVKLKDSGVQWIGDIPEKWEVRKLKHIISFINGFAFDSNTFDLDGEFPVIRIGDISGNTVSYENIAKVKSNEGLENYKIKTNDILIAMSGATTGKIGKVLEGQDGYINQRVGIIRSEQHHFINYMLQTTIFLDYIVLSSNGSAQPNISSGQIQDFPIALPPLSEQRSIASYLDEQCGAIDTAIGQLQRQIALLQERKQILINEVVTGKVKVI